MINTFINFAQLNNCPDGKSDPSCLTTLPNLTAGSETLTTILSIVFGVVSAAAVIIIMIQGIRFALSGGDPEKSKNARKGVIYALVGLAISLSANIIVIFVLKEVI